MSVAAWPVRAPIGNPQNRDLAANIADSTQEIPLTGHANDQARPLFLDVLTRLLAPGHNRDLHAPRARRRPRQLELILVKATRKKEKNAVGCGSRWA